MFLYRTLCTGLLISLHTAAFAQSKLDSIQQLDEVTIVANRLDRYREVIPSQRLAGEKLEALSSFSVADAIRYFSGVQIKDYGGVGGLKTVDIRSMGTNHLGVFYDGIQLGNAQNGQIDLGKFSLDNIEEISLYNGQKSEIFQSAKDFGSAGTIYLRTRRPQFSGKEKTNIKTFFRSGSFDLLNPSVLWEQKISKNISSSLNAEYIYSSGKYPFRYRKVLPDKTVAWDTTAVRQNGDIRSLRFEGGINGYTANGYWHAKAYFYDSEKGIPGAIVNNVWKRSQRQWDRNFFAQFSSKNIIPLPKNDELLLNIKYASDWMRYLNPDTTLMYIDNSFCQKEFYASIANKYSFLQNWDINFSVDYQYNTLTSNLKNFVYPTRNTLLAALATAFEWRRLKAQASVLGSFVFENVEQQNAEKPADKSEYTPAVFLSYKPFMRHDFNLRIFYKRIFRMPTFNDLYYTDIGNIKLRPEYTVQYNIGFQYDKYFKKGTVNHLNFRVDAYYNEVTDKIVAIPKGNGQYRWMMMNLGYVEIRGVDFSGRAETRLGKIAGKQCVASLHLNYTFQRAQDFSNPKDNDPVSGSYGSQIAYIPWHNGSAIASIAWRTWDLNYSFIYVGERYHNSSNIRENYEQPWYTHDLTVGKMFSYRKIKCRLSAEVNNILNQYYDVVLNYPMPGRNFKIILKIEI
ncbi:MAG: TonB-dependent receptor [Prevotellaceae bacterium]|jgi:outer membrane cobalamin receptor|nr:TonB-dependent receptor [Prevotellaceae bacterium]